MDMVRFKLMELFSVFVTSFCYGDLRTLHFGERNMEIPIHSVECNFQIKIKKSLSFILNSDHFYFSLWFACYIIRKSDTLVEIKSPTNIENLLEYSLIGQKLNWAQMHAPGISCVKIHAHFQITNNWFNLSVGSETRLPFV